MIQQVIKRNGAVVPFNPERITNAIYRAAVAVGGRDRDLAERLTGQVIEVLEQTISPGEIPTVEDTQDVVEKALIESGHARTAKAYILYRYEQSRRRRKKISQRDRDSENIPYRKIWEVLSWSVDHNVHTVERLNQRIERGEFPDIVRESDAAYEEDVAAAAGLITDRRDEVKIVVIAGPSSSGKTTTTTKLGKRLQEAGLSLVALNIDNYFFDLELHPQDEYGDYDFETPQALDLELINRHLVDLIAGREIQMPYYDFKSGKRADETIPMRIGPDDIILIDSLHGLYGPMTDSLPDTFCRLGDPERHWDGQVLVQEMLQQAQTQAEETQIAPVGTMNDLHPPISLGNDAQVDYPDVGQASGNHQLRQPSGVRDVALVQPEPTALLVGEESFNTEPLRVPVTGFFFQFHVGDQIDGVLVRGLPPSDSQDRAVFLTGKSHFWYPQAVTLLYPYFFPGKFAALLTKDRALGGAADIFPTIVVNRSQECDPIEFTIPQKDHLAPFRYQFVNLSQQFNVALLGEMPLFPSNNNPGQGQSPFLVDDADHQGHAATANPAAIHCQDQWSVGEACQQCFGKGQKVYLGLDTFVFKPTIEFLLAACLLGSIGCLFRHRGQMGALAPDYSTNHCSQRVQLSGKIAFWFPRVEVLQCLADGTESSYIIAHGQFLPNFDIGLIIP